MGAGRGPGQATVEFGVVLGLVLLLLLGCTQIGLYALTRGAAVTAAERGVYVAVGASGSPTGHPAVSAVYSAIRFQLASGLVGATTAQMQPAHESCPALDPSWPTGTVYVCAVSNPTTGTVEVAIRGWIHAAVPPSFGLGGRGWRTGALPIDVDDVVHTAVFAP